MQAKSLSIRSFVHCTSLTIVGLCLCLLSSTVVRAQKTPTIFKTENGNKTSSTSATNMDFINGLEVTAENAEGGNKEAAKIARNKLIYIGVEQIDTEFNNYRKKSRKRNDLLQFIFDFLEIGASTAIAITGGERVKEVIGEALTGFKGARTSFNKNFKLLELQILFNKMVSKRSQRLSAIYEKLNEDVVSYPWERARVELRDYFYAGTIDEALSSLNIDTGSEASSEQQKLEDIKVRAGILGAPSEIEIRNSRVNTDAIDALVDAFSAADDKVTSADKIIADADKTIAAAVKTIADENAKTSPDQAVITKANQDKTKAEADKAKAVTVRDSATKDRDAALSNLKGTYEAIEGDTALSPLLDKIPDLPGYSADFKARLQDSLKRLKEKKATVEDYALIMLQVGKVVRMNLSKDSTLNERLQNILKVNK